MEQWKTLTKNVSHNIRNLAAELSKKFGTRCYFDRLGGIYPKVFAFHGGFVLRHTFSNYIIINLFLKVVGLSSSS